MIFSEYNAIMTKSSVENSTRYGVEICTASLTMEDSWILHAVVQLRLAFSYA
jgi:hypothetical protein